MNIEQLKQLYPELGEYDASHLNKAEATTAETFNEKEEHENDLRWESFMAEQRAYDADDITDWEGQSERQGAE